MAVICQDLDETKRPSKAAKYSGWEQSVQTFQRSLSEQQPIDGILGMSTLQKYVKTSSTSVSHFNAQVFAGMIW